MSARHLLTSNFEESESASPESFLKLCRLYGKINPEETHVVLFYIPQYVRDGLRQGLTEVPHITEMQNEREGKIIEELTAVL